MPDLELAASGELLGKVAIVTGGGSGIGRSVARRFAAAGARVAILDVNAGDTHDVIIANGGNAMFIECDVTSQAAVDQAFVRVTSEFALPDVLVNSAGIAHVGNIELTAESDFDRVFAVNVKGVYNCLHAAVPVMKGRGGVILNIASVASWVGIPARFAYSMSKGAVLTMTRSVACDYVGDGIRCNSVSPARVHTPFVDGFLKQNYPGRESEMFATLSRTQPIGRMGTPDEIASLALFLCSDAASFITGTDVAIDGGFISLRPPS
jgi:NAD(P)-dependent dehydrogenase (short-subunit alcohol dehydrogenase family)